MTLASRSTWNRVPKLLAISYSATSKESASGTNLCTVSRSRTPRACKLSGVASTCNGSWPPRLVKSSAWSKPKKAQPARRTPPKCLPGSTGMRRRGPSSVASSRTSHVRFGTSRTEKRRKTAGKQGISSMRAASRPFSNVHSRPWMASSADSSTQLRISLCTCATNSCLLGGWQGPPAACDADLAAAPCAAAAAIRPASSTTACSKNHGNATARRLKSACMSSCSAPRHRGNSARPSKPIMNSEAWLTQKFATHASSQRNTCSVWCQYSAPAASASFGCAASCCRCDGTHAAKTTPSCNRIGSISTPLGNKKTGRSAGRPRRRISSENAPSTSATSTCSRQRRYARHRRWTCAAALWIQMPCNGKSPSFGGATLPNNSAQSSI
mmetsp:Transcript_90854/g.256627  ORF Transcript_90854/g.256627 Transcript_90854/m.256627 type:complete len:383 (+) Transcript_90854:2114-3262(+)